LATLAVWQEKLIHLYRIGLSIIATGSDKGGSAAGVQLLITLFYKSLPSGSSILSKVAIAHLYI
jgi:hypothetical protein